MIEELLPHLYRIQVPLPRSPLKYLNSYVIKDKERSLIIDTGMNREECLESLTTNLKQLDIDLNHTDFFITHIHADHSGLVGTLATETSAVYFNARETKLFGQTNPWRTYSFNLYLSSGFPEDELRKAIEAHPGIRFGLKKKLDFKILAENDTLQVGDFSFRVVETPGHSPGHLCLYESVKQILVCGDHILFDITPNITYWPQMDNSLGQYLKNLDKVYDLEVKMLLPGHRSLIHDHRQRIRELQEHHGKRLEEVLHALSDGAKDVYHIAPCVTWAIKARSWEEFPPQQKWFAFGETVAHLVYLEKEGKVRRINTGGKITFALN
ncbi:MBL fold metallo-hydrolase [Chloroflexota bacterium]